MASCEHHQDIMELMEDLDRLEAEFGRRLWQMVALTSGRQGASGAASQLLERVREQILSWCAEPKTGARFGCEAVAATVAAVEDMTNRKFALYLRVLLDVPARQGVPARDAA